MHTYQTIDHVAKRTGHKLRSAGDSTAAERRQMLESHLQDAQAEGVAMHCLPPRGPISWRANWAVLLQVNGLL